MATNPSKFPRIAFAQPRDWTSARNHASTAIAKSLHRQIHAGWLLLQTAKRFPSYDESHTRFVKSSERVLKYAEAQLWQVELEDADLVEIVSEFEGLWFAIDALS